MCKKCRQWPSRFAIVDKADPLLPPIQSLATAHLCAVAGWVADDRIRDPLFHGQSRGGFSGPRFATGTLQKKGLVRVEGV
jgi:hypothetical protein